MFKTITFEVIGDQPLHCENCERRVERMLKPMQGVSRVRAQAKNQQIEVLLDAAVLEPDEIVDRLAAAGYQAKPIPPANG